MGLLEVLGIPATTCLIANTFYSFGQAFQMMVSDYPQRRIRYGHTRACDFWTRHNLQGHRRDAMKDSTSKQRCPTGYSDHTGKNIELRDRHLNGSLHNYILT
jgi:hypothetical protein